MALEIVSPSTIETVSHLAAKEAHGIKIEIDNDAVISSGAQERLRIIFNENPGSPSDITWTVLGQPGHIEFVSAVPTSQPPTFPDESECRNATGLTLADWIDTHLIPHFRSIEAFDAYDIFRSSTNAINFRRTIAAANAIEFTSPGFDATIAHLVNGVAPTVDPNYFVRLQIMVSDDQEGDFLGTRSPWLYLKPELAAGTAPKVDVNISDVLTSMVNSYDIPASNNQSWGLITQSVKKFIVRYGEYYGDNPQFKQIFSTPLVRCFNGGRLFGDRALDVWNTYKNKFITNRHQPWVDKRLPDWLYFMEPDIDTATHMCVRFLVQYTGYDTSYTTDIIPKGNIGRVLRVPCGIEQVGVDESNIYNDVEFYSVAVYASNSAGVPTGDPVVGPFLFNVIPHSDTATGIQYFNFMGLMETQVLDSEIEQGIEWDRELSTVETFTSVTDMETEDTHRHRASSIEKQTEIACSTGALTRRNWMAAQDILLSERIWYVNPNSGVERMAAQIVPGSDSMIPFSNNGESVHALAFKITLNKENTNSTPVQLING